jgi:hypothetical protein
MKKTKSKKKVKFVYAAIKGQHMLSNRDAQIIGPELVRINAENGCLKPEIVVDEARPKNSVLHDHFEWDDDKAAYKYRLQEARQLIRCIRIIDPGIPIDEQPAHRAFVHVSADPKEGQFEGEGYIPIARAMGRKAYRQQVLQEALNAARHWQRKYEDLKELTLVFAEIDKVAEKTGVEK